MARSVLLAGAAGVCLALPATASAAPPVCMGAELITLMNAPLTLPAPQCQGAPPGATPTLVSGPASGSITGANPYVYTPNAGFYGRDSFRYTVSNADGPSNEATVGIYVNARPTCNDGAATVAMNSQVLLNALPCTDLDAPAEWILWATDGFNGRIDFVDERVITYTPNPGFFGTDSIMIAAEDRFGFMSPDATITLTVTGPPPPAPPAPPPPAAPRDLAAPLVTLKTADKATLAKGIPLTLSVNERATATLTATLSASQARRVKLGRTVGTLKATLTAGRSKLTLKLSSKARRTLKKLRSVRVTVTAVVTDTAGNQVTRRVGVSLRR